MNLSIVGAGIHGLCTALQAAERGWDVDVYDLHRIPNQLSSSFDEHRLIRYAYGHDGGYAHLVGFAYPAWERLWSVLGRSLYVPTGTLAVSSRESGHVDSSVRIMKRLGVEADIIDVGHARNISPHVILHDDEVIMWSPSGGVLLAERILHALALACRERKVRLHEDYRVASGQDFPHADYAIWTQGAWSPGVQPSRQLVAYFNPPPGSWTGNHPMVLDLVGADGFYLVPGVAGTRWKLGIHRTSGAGHPDDARSLTDCEIHYIKTAARRRLSGLPEHITLSGAACYYALVGGDRFQLHETAQGIRFAGGSGHSFKFGALVGETLCCVAAGEMTFDDAQKLLAGQSPI